MSTSLSGLSTNFFPSAQNGFTTTLASTIASGAATVPLNSVAGYTNGQIAVFVVDPTDASKKQTFTGVIDTAGVQVTSVVWTAGTNVQHSAGATVVDYATATHIAMMTKGITVQHNQDGTHGAVTATSVTTSGAVLTTPKVITSINDTNGNELAKVTATASAVNEVTLANAATGNAPNISSTGDDTNIDLKLTPKGTGRVVLNGAGAPTSALVATLETTSSTSFTDLATPGPAVTVTIGTSGIALVILSASLSNGTIGDYAVMGFVASGTNTIAASSTRALFKKAEATSNDTQATWAYLATGLTVGSTTFTAKYECLTGGTSTFLNRNIAVIPF